ncbi:MAG: hypothetical protein WCH62_03115 [Candidatus Omnitrophota bacterium]
MSNIIFNSVNKVEDFVWWRLTGFIFMMMFLLIFGYFLRKSLKIERIWVILIIVLIGLLPASTVYVLWICVVFQGFFNLIFASMAYFALESARNSPKYKFHWGISASLIFIISLFHYPPTSLIVFAFTFAYVVFADSNNWAQVKRRVILDVTFFGVSLIIYRCLERAWVTPFFFKYKMLNQDPYYDMGLVQNLLIKQRVLAEAFFVSFAGSFDFIFHIMGGLIGFAFVYLIVSLALIRLRSSFFVEEKRLFIERLLVCFMLLVLSVLPIILAKNVTNLTGYRFVFVSSVMAVLTLVALLRWVFEKKIFLEPWVSRFAAVFMLSCALIVSLTLSDIVRNYKKEFDYINNKLSKADLINIKYFIYIRLSHSQVLINRSLPYEYNLMIEQVHHFSPFILSACNAAGISGHSRCRVLPSSYSGQVIAKPYQLVFDPAELKR